MVKETNISVIYTFGGKKENRSQCVASIKSIPDSVEVICVGENADQKTMEAYEEIAKEKKNVQVLSVEGNHQKALNSGISKATKEYVVLVNEGIIVSDTIDNLSEFWTSKTKDTDLVMYDMEYDRSASVDFESESSMSEMKERHVIYSKNGVYRIDVHPYNFYIAENISVHREFAVNHTFDETISWKNALFLFFMEVVAEKNTISVCADMSVKSVAVISSEDENDRETGAKIFQKVIEKYQDQDVWVKRFCYSTILQEINQKYINGEIFKDMSHLDDIDLEYQKLIQQMEVISIIKTTISAANRVFFVKLNGAKCQLSSDFLSFVLYYGDYEICSGNGVSAYITYMEREGDDIRVRLMVGNPIFSMYKPTFFMIKGKKRTKIEPEVSNYQYSVGNDSNVCYYTLEYKLSAIKTETISFETEFAGMTVPVKFKRRRNFPHGNFPQDRIFYFGSTKLVFTPRKMKTVNQGMRSIAVKMKRENELKKVIEENDEKRMNLVGFRCDIQKYLKQTKDLGNIVFVGVENNDTRAFELYTKYKNSNVYYITEDASLVDGNHVLALDSDKAKMVFCSAKYIYVDVLDYKKVCPLEPEERIAVADLLDYKVMYLTKPESLVDNIAVYGEDVIGMDGMVMLSEEQEKIVREKYTYRIVSQEILL